MASSTHEFQFAVPTCEEHSKEELFFYCNTCKKRICELCIKGDHNKHDWSSNSKYARKIRNEGIQTSEHITKEIIPTLKARTAAARKELSRKSIIQTQQELKGTIDAYAKYLLAVVDDESDDDQDIEKMIAHFIKIAEFFKEKTHSAHDNVVIDMREEYDVKMDELQKLILRKAEFKSFQKGILEEETIKDMFGSISLVIPIEKMLKKDLVRSFMFGTKPIIDIIAGPEDKAWIHVFKSNQTTLINETGKTIKEIYFGRNYNSFVISGKSHVFTSTEDEAVLGCRDGNISTIYSTSPFYSSGMCHSREGGIIVCLIEGDRSEITPTTKGEVHHIDMSGKLVKKYVTEKDTNSPLFTWPNKVAQNVNLDLCVLDFVNEKENDRLVNVAVDGRLRFTYTGQPKLKERFLGENVTCDSVGRIFITDRLNNAIHVLNVDGDFLEFFLTAEEGIHGPTSLSIHNNKVWVTFKNNGINIYRLKN